MEKGFSTLTMSRILEQLADQHEERIINVLYQLEDDVINEVTKATKGSLVSQRLAIQLRPQIKALVEKNFLNDIIHTIEDHLLGNPIQLHLYHAMLNKIKILNLVDH